MKMIYRVNRIRTAIPAITVVLLMLIVPVSAIAGPVLAEEGSGADTGSGTGTNLDSYLNEKIADYTYRLSVNGGNLIVEKKSNDNWESMIGIKNDNGTINVGSWGFNSATGIGPFNSFYVEMDESGVPKAILNPDNLNEKKVLYKDGEWKSLEGSIGGSTGNNDKEVDSGNNIMWVLPKVYIGMDDAGLILSNRQFNGGVATAHIIDGKVYPFLALGVYEASEESGKLMSKPGVVPSVSKNRYVFQSAAQNTYVNGESMIWNYYQWQLYRMCSFAVMGGFDSQKIVGEGITSDPDGKHKTGESYGKGPYYGSSDKKEVSKLFLENSWGNVWEFVGDAHLVWETSSMPVIYAGQNSDWGSGNYGSKVVSTKASLPTSSDFSTICVDEAISWGLPITSGGVLSKDYFWTNTNDTGDRALLVGGGWSNSSYAGVSALDVYSGVSFSRAAVGSRLAYVFGAGAAPDGTTDTGVIWELENGTLTVNEGGESVNDASNGTAPWYTIIKNAEKVSWENVTAIGDELQGALPGTTLEIKGAISSISNGALKDYRLVGFTKDNIQKESSLILENGILKVNGENAKLIWSDNGTNINISSLGGQPGWLHHSKVDTLIFTGNAWTDGSFSDTVVKKIVADNISTLSGSDVKGITGLTSISVKKLTEFGEGTFEGFTSLSKVVGSKITNIGNRAFSGCSSLQTIYLDNLITVGDYALQGTGIGPILSFSKLTTVGEGAFSGCAQITNVTMSGIDHISRFLFQNCSNLSSVVTKDLVSIGESAFSGCKNLKGLGPEASDIDLRFVYTIEKSAFRGCANIVSVRAYVVSEIGQDAFRECGNLKGFNSGAADTQNAFVPPLTLKVIGDNAFNGVTFDKAHLYQNVSCGSTVMKVTGTLYIHDSSVLSGLNNNSIVATPNTDISIPDDDKAGWKNKINGSNTNKMKKAQTTQVAFNLAGGFPDVGFETESRNVIAGTQVLLPFVKHAGKYLQFSFGVYDNGTWSPGCSALDTGKKSGELLTIYPSGGLKYLVNGPVNDSSGEYDRLLGNLNETMTIELDNGSYPITSESSFEDGSGKYVATVKYGDSLTFPTVIGGFTVSLFEGKRSGNIPYSDNGTNVTVGFYETEFKMVVIPMPFKVTLTIHGYSYSVRTIEGGFDLPNREEVLNGSTEWGGFGSWNTVSANGYDITKEITWYCGAEKVNPEGVTVASDTNYNAEFPLKKSIVTISANGLDLSMSLEMEGKYGFTVGSDGNIMFTDQNNNKKNVSPNKIAPGYRFIGYVSNAPGLVSPGGYLSSGSELLNDLTISMMVTEMNVDIKYTFTMGGTAVNENNLDWLNGEKVTIVTTRQLSNGVKIPLPAYGKYSLESVKPGTSNNVLEIGSDGTVTVDVTHMSDSNTLILNCVFSNKMTLYIDWGVEGFKVRNGVLDDTGHIIPTRPAGLDSERTGYRLLGYGTSGSEQNNVIIPPTGAAFKDVKNKLLGSGLIKDNIITIYAVWKPMSISVSLKDQGSSTPCTVLTGDKMYLYVPEMMGHVFGGWVPTKDGHEGGPVSDELEITSSFLNNFGKMSDNGEWSVVLESKWAPRDYILEFYNTGTDRKIQELKVTFGKESDSTFPSLEYSAVLDNMTNTGWKTLVTEGASPAVRYPGAKITVDQELAKFADEDWVIRFDTLRVATEYTVKFMNGDSPVGHTLTGVKVNDRLDILDHKGFVKAGYTPIGWHWNEDSLEAMTATTLIYEMTAVAEDNTVLLHLIWQQLIYNIGYSLDGGTIDDRAPALVPYGQWIDIPDPSKLGYSFKGWKVTGITSDARYEMFGASQKLEEGREVDSSRFKDLNSNAGGIVTMTAVWNPVEYTVQYDLNGGSGDPPRPEAAQVGKKLSAPSTVNSKLDGYEFSGWSLDGVAVIKELEFTSAMAKRADKDGVVTLLAVWTPVQYEIQFRNLDTEKYTSVKAYYGIAAQIGEPERTGYTFMGWTSTDVKGNAMFSPDGTVWYSWPSSGPADGCFLRDLTSGKGAIVHLTASWSANDYRISYNANGGTGEIPKDQNLYKVGDPLKLASTESLKGTNGNRLILGWSMDQTATVPMTLETFVEGMAERANLANAVTLYAVWVEGSYKVTVDVGGSKPSMVPSGWTLGDDGRYWRDADYGTSMKEVMSDWDSVLLELEGHVFTSWSYDVGSVVTDVDVKAEFDEVRQWIIYAFTGIVAFIAIIAFVYTRFERW